MRRAGRVVAEMHERIRAAIRPGVTTLDLDLIGRKVLADRGATSNFLDYHGYPAVICASPNDVIVHGIPEGPCSGGRHRVVDAEPSSKGARRRRLHAPWSSRRRRPQLIG